MDKLKLIINSPYFRAALAGGIAAALYISGNIFYSGIALGVGVRELLIALRG